MKTNETLFEVLEKQMRGTVDRLTEKQIQYMLSSHAKGVKIRIVDFKEKTSRGE